MSQQQKIPAVIPEDEPRKCDLCLGRSTDLYVAPISRPMLVCEQCYWSRQVLDAVYAEILTRSRRNSTDT